MAAKKTRKRKSASTPWERDAPRQARHTKLSSSDKTAAKKRAKKAGRTYPNLVDNMAVAKKKRGSSRNAATKDPRGGLTAAGRTMLRRRDGSRLKPGVTKPEEEMTPDEMRRKGSWALRFYGRKRLPPLIGKNGLPARLALTARAWGELVPRTLAAARRIAARGKRLLERYRLQQA
jgi:hypothetical protein